MKNTLKKIWAYVGVSGIIIAALWGNLIYMNLRPSDDILEGWAEYTPAHFEQLMATDEPVLVEIYASWCPTCLLQHKAFETLVDEGRAPRINAVRVDFERDVDFIQKHKFLGTGYLLIFRSGKEIKRASGLITSEKISQFLQGYQ